MPRDERDRILADTGWGVKPDDQPANASQAGDGAHRVFPYQPDQPDVVRRILRAQRRGFNSATRVRIQGASTFIVDINRDVFTVEGLGFGDENLILLLQALGAAFSPAEIRAIGRDETAAREFELTRAWAWGAERTG